jgi:hypothetical protein
MIARLFAFGTAVLPLLAVAPSWGAGRCVHTAFSSQELSNNSGGASPTATDAGAPDSNAIGNCPVAVGSGALRLTPPVRHAIVSGRQGTIPIIHPLTGERLGELVIHPITGELLSTPNTETETTDRR